MCESKINNTFELIREYAENPSMNRQVIVKLVRGLQPTELVKLYIQCPISCTLRNIIHLRLTRLNYISWVKILNLKCCTIDFVEQFSGYVCWTQVSKLIPLNDKDIVRLKYKLNFYTISSYQKLSEEIILMFADRLDWRRLCKKQTLTENIIVQCTNLICPYTVLKYQRLSEQVIKKILQIEHVNVVFALQCATKYQILTHKFIVENYLVLPIFKLVKYQKLQENTIYFLAQCYIKETLISEQVRNELWQDLICEQNVSIQFCKDFTQFIDFNYLVKTKPLSEDFLWEFKYKFDWKIAFNSQRLTKTFLENLPKAFTYFSGQKEILEDLKCTICLDIFKNPVLSNPCLHIFCMLCIQHSLKYLRSCPLCRHILIAF